MYIYIYIYMHTYTYMYIYVHMFTYIIMGATQDGQRNSGHLSGKPFWELPSIWSLPKDLLLEPIPRMARIHTRACICPYLYIFIFKHVYVCI